MTLLRKWLFRGFVLLASLLVISLAATFLLLATPYGLSLTTSMIGSLASNKDMRIELSGLTSALGDIKLEALHIADKEGVWLEARDLSARYSLIKLARLDLAIDHLTLEALTIKKTPSPVTDPKPANNGPLVPNLPLSQITADRITINKITLEEAVLGKAAELTFQSALHITGAPFKSDGKLTLIHASEASGGIEAKWDLDPSRNRRQLALRLSEPRGGLAARLLDIAQLPSIDIRLEGDGTAKDWRSDLDIQLDGKPVVAGQMVIGISNQSNQIKASLAGQLSPFLPRSLLPLVAGNSNLLVSIEQSQTDIIHLHQLDFSSGLARIEARGQIDNKQQMLDVATSFELGQEGTLIEVQQSDANALILGQIKLDGHLTGPLQKATLKLDGSLDHISQNGLVIDGGSLSIASQTIDLVAQKAGLTASLQFAEVSTGNSHLDTMLAGDKRLELQAEVDGQTIDLSAAHLNTDLLKAQLSGIYAPDSLNLDGSFSITDLKPLDPTLTGSLSGIVAIEGSPIKPSLVLNLGGKSLSASGKSITDLKLKVLANGAGRADMTLSAFIDKAPMKASFKLEPNADGSRSIDNLRITAPGTDMSGQLLIFETGLAQGSLDAKISDLAALGPLLLQPDLSGSLDATISLTTSDGKQSIKIDARAPGIETRDIALTGMGLSSSIDDATGAMTMQSNLEVGTILAAGERIRSLRAQMTGKDGILPFTVSASLSNAPMRIQGRLLQQNGQNAVDLSRLSGNWKGIAFALSEPTQLALGNGIRFERPMKMMIDGGSVTVTGASSEQLDLDLAIAGLPLSIIEKIAPSGERLSGQINGVAKVSGPSGDPSVSWQTKLTNITANSVRKAGLPSFTLSSSGRFRNNLVSMQNHLTGGGADLRADGQLALARKTMTIKATGSVPFSLAARSLADAGLQLTGTAYLAAAISGPFDEPDIRGTITTQGARFSEFSSGLIVRNLGGTLRLVGQQVEIQTLTGQLGKDGILSVNGTVGLEANQGMPADIRLTIKNGSFKHEEILTSLFDANLRLSGQLANRSVISGQVNLNTTDIHIPEKLPVSLSSVDVSHKNAKGSVAEQAKRLGAKPDKTGTEGPAMALDLTISSPRRIYVRGRGIDSELGGTIRITGTTASPNPTGSIGMQRGRLDILTKRLDFDTGRVTFAGTLDPSLDFSASTTNGGTTFTFGVGGYASAPEISLSSSPSMPEDEILAQLFFDRNLSDLSPVQLAQLANAVATLSGVNSGPGLLDRLRSAAGIDNIDIKSDKETGETTVGVGRYINDKTYINVEKSTSSNAGKVKIDLDITDNFKAQGEADSEGRTKAGIFFEKDY